MIMNVLTPIQEQVQRTTTKPTPERHLTTNDVPPLQNGDRLTRAEFERRYVAHPEIKKAELVEGVVYVPSPVYARHGAPHSDIIGWLSVYRAATPHVRVFDNTSLRLDIDNEPQPDACVWIEDLAPNGVSIDLDDMLEIKPLLIVEVASSSSAYDLYDKRDVYRRNGVQEYIVLLTFEQEVRWFAWREGEYELIQPDDEGVLHSRVLPGLWLEPTRFWQGDLAGVLTVLQQGLASPEHATFVEQARRQTG
jgi:Uma2 family endonuclease